MAAVESLLASDPHLVKEAWIRMWGWYKEAFDRFYRPARANIKWMMAETVALYHHAPLMIQTIPVEATPLSIVNYIPVEEEVAEAVKRI